MTQQPGTRCGECKLRPSGHGLANLTMPDQAHEYQPHYGRATMTQPTGVRTMTDLNLADLRSVAAAATQGEWWWEVGVRTDGGMPQNHVIHGDDGKAVAVTYSHELIDVGGGDFVPAVYGRKENATHIATFDPPTVTMLLDDRDMWEMNCEECANLLSEARAALAAADELLAATTTLLANDHLHTVTKPHGLYPMYEPLNDAAARFRALRGGE